MFVEHIVVKLALLHAWLQFLCIFCDKQTITIWIGTVVCIVVDYVLVRNNWRTVGRHAIMGSWNHCKLRGELWQIAHSQQWFQNCKVSSSTCICGNVLDVGILAAFKPTASPRWFGGTYWRLLHDPSTGVPLVWTWGRPIVAVTP